MASFTTEELPPPPAFNEGDLPPPASSDEGNSTRKPLKRAQSGAYSVIEGWFETKSASMFKKTEKCYVRLLDKTISVYTSDKEKKTV